MAEIGFWPGFVIGLTLGIGMTLMVVVKYVNDEDDDDDTEFKL